MAAPCAWNSPGRCGHIAASCRPAAPCDVRVIFQSIDISFRGLRCARAVVVGIVPQHVRWARAGNGRPRRKQSEQQRGAAPHG